MQNAQSALMMNQLFMIAVIFGIFYFLVFRPQQKREKEHQALLKNLAKNDEVITTGGIHGTVVNLKEKSVVLRVDENVKIEVERSCISTVSRKAASA